MPYVRKPLAKHLSTTFFDFIIIWWTFTHTWLTTYVDSCNLQNWKKKLMHLCNLVKNNKRKLIQRHIQIIVIWMIGVIIFIINMTSKKKIKSNQIPPTSRVEPKKPTNIHGIGPTPPPLNLHIIYADVLCNFTKKNTQNNYSTITSRTRPITFFLHTTHNLFILDVHIHCIK